jgi:hypothetical protein
MNVSRKNYRSLGRGLSGCISAAEFIVRLLMGIGWSSLTFTPDDEAVRELSTSWDWLIQEPFTPILFSVLGDVFFHTESSGVWWLNTGTGEISLVADSVEQFREKLGTEIVEEWFLPSLVEQLHAAGKIPGPSCCYTYVTLPVFAEGKYEIQNLNPVPAKLHFAATGHLHKEFHSLPDGANVKLNVVP